MTRPDAAASFTLLGAIEARWRDALSFVAADDPRSAAREVERAGELLHRLGPIEELAAALEPSLLAELSGRLQRLTKLHHELVAASRDAQQSLGRRMGEAREGRAALAAYGDQVEPEHACDEIG